MSVPLLSEAISLAEGYVGATGLVVLGVAGALASIPNGAYLSSFPIPLLPLSKWGSADGAAGWCFTEGGHAVPCPWYVWASSGQAAGARGWMNTSALVSAWFGLLPGKYGGIEVHGVGLWPFVILILAGLSRMGVLANLIQL
jgi:hypothetical protein